MIVYGVDPGFRQSALVILDNGAVAHHEIVDNDVMLSRLEYGVLSYSIGGCLCVEHISMGGMIAGAEIFDTCIWTGRFIERWHGQRWALLKRKDVKMHLCGAVNVKDGNVRQALIDRFGPGKDMAVGTKKNRGPLYGVASHEWAALAVAVTWYDLNKGTL